MTPWRFDADRRRGSLHAAPFLLFSLLITGQVRVQVGRLLGCMDDLLLNGKLALLLDSEIVPFLQDNRLLLDPPHRPSMANGGCLREAFIVASRKFIKHCNMCELHHDRSCRSTRS